MNYVDVSWNPEGAVERERERELLQMLRWGWRVGRWEGESENVYRTENKKKHGEIEIN